MPGSARPEQGRGQVVRRRWRFYASGAGREPVADVLRGLSAIDRAAVAAEMRGIAREGLEEARHIRGDIYEVRAQGDRQAFRLLFAPEGSKGRVLLALEVFSKKTPKTPPAAIAVAERRLAEWRARH